MTDEEIEYLVRALSEARSRAAEITVSVRARVGVEHRLGDLGNVAVFKIETLLDEVRRFALGDPETSLGRAVEPPKANTPAASAGPPANPPAMEVFSPADEGAGHWFHAFMSELNSSFRASGGITFEAAEELLRRHKQAFEKDLDTARRMYRTYPRLFAAAATQAGGGVQANGAPSLKPETHPENRNGF